MNFNRVKIRWAKKLLQSKFFVLLTDKSSVIALDGVEPDSFNDQMALNAQSAELQAFKTSLTDLITEHDDALAKMRGYGKTKSKKAK